MRALKADLPRRFLCGVSCPPSDGDQHDAANAGGRGRLWRPLRREAEFLHRRRRRDHQGPVVCSTAHPMA